MRIFGSLVKLVIALEGCWYVNMETLDEGRAYKLKFFFVS